MGAEALSVRIVDYLGRESMQTVDSLAAYIRDQAFVKFYDCADVEPDNRMTPLDWAASTLLQAPIRRYAPFVDLERNGAEMWAACDKALERLGPDQSLASAEAPAVRGRVEDAFRAFMRPSGIGPSIAAKTLHKKRPALIPVVDDFVSSVLCGQHGATLSARSLTDVVYDRFRPLLLENSDALEAVAQSVETTCPLTTTRILDIAIWSHADGERPLYDLRSR